MTRQPKTAYRGVGAIQSMVTVASLVFGIGMVCGLALLCCEPGPKLRTIAAFATDLDGRTPHQRFNAIRACSMIDGRVVLPGDVFSFDRCVGGWCKSRGFLIAPVSYNGRLVDDFGGGVCQTSTTLYNAALLAGLPIVERHAHSFSPSYAPPGRDAAVAYASVDLQFRNSYSWPIVIHAGLDGHMIVASITGAGPTSRVELQTRVLQIYPPPLANVPLGQTGSTLRWHVLGRDGMRVAVYRWMWSSGGEPLGRELVSDHTYLAIPAAEIGSK